MKNIISYVISKISFTEKEIMDVKVKDTFETVQNNIEDSAVAVKESVSNGMTIVKDKTQKVIDSFKKSQEPVSNYNSYHKSEEAC